AGGATPRSRKRFAIGFEALLSPNHYAQPGALLLCQWGLSFSAADGRCPDPAPVAKAAVILLGGSARQPDDKQIGTAPRRKYRHSRRSASKPMFDTCQIRFSMLCRT